MNTAATTRRRAGFNAIDLMIVLACLALAAAFYLSLLNRPRASKVNCVSNLKQVGLGLRIWSNDHEDRFPMSVSTNEGGTREFDQGPLTYLHFLNLSNELGNPKILRCPKDGSRIPATGWQQLRADGNRAVSYFVSLDTDEAKILAGDRNLTAPRQTNGILFIQADGELRSIQGAHEKVVNIAFTDGSVAQFNGAASASAGPVVNVVTNAFDARTNMPFRLSLPITP